MPHASSLQSVRTLQPGHLLGRWVVIERIAAGGMAELYLGRVDGPPRFAKAVALKLLHAHLAEDPDFVRMFEKEARIAATLDHPNIVQVLDVDVSGPEPLLVLEYVHGRDLRRVLRRGGRLPLGAAVRIAVDVARALHHAHVVPGPDGRPLGLVHRDVSPANVLVSFYGAVKLADFGIAKAAAHTVATATGNLKGKFGYMSPEQSMQEPLDARSDVFSLGVVLYEATTGARAFDGEAVTIMNKVLAGDYAAPASVVSDYPAALADIVARALALEPGDRFASAGAMADALEAFAADQGLDTGRESLARYVRALFDDPPPPSLDVPVVRPQPAVAAGLDALEAPHRPRRPLALTGLVVLAVGVGGIVGWRVARSSASAGVEASPSGKDAEAEVSPAASAPESRDPAGSPPDEDEQSHAAAARAPDVGSEPAVVPAPPPDPTPAVSAGDSRAEASERRRRRRRAAKRKPSPPTSEVAPREGMFPKGMQ